jgi:hypothetical protein
MVEVGKYLGVSILNFVACIYLSYEVPVLTNKKTALTMRLIEFIKANLPLDICSQLQPYFDQAERQSTTSEEEGKLLGLLLKEAFENDILTQETLLLVKKAAGIHRGSTYFMKEGKLRIMNPFSYISFLPSRKRLVWQASLKQE